MIPARTALPVLLVAALATGCSPDHRPDDRAGMPRPTADSTLPAAPLQPNEAPVDPAAAPLPDPAAADAAPWTVRDTRSDGVHAGVATLRRVETGRHSDFDRIVLDFGDDTLPSYRIAYIDRPVRQCGSGDAVPLPGDAWLEIHTEPARAHTDAGAPTIQARQRQPGLPALLALVMTCDFEAHVTWVAAVPAPEEYRVLQLRDPARLVVDIRHSRTR